MFVKRRMDLKLIESIDQIDTIEGKPIPKDRFYHII